MGEYHLYDRWQNATLTFTEWVMQDTPKLRLMRKFLIWKDEFRDNLYDGLLLSWPLNHQLSAFFVKMNLLDWFNTFPSNFLFENIVKRIWYSVRTSRFYDVEMPKLNGLWYDELLIMVYFLQPVPRRSWQKFTVFLLESFKTNLNLDLATGGIIRVLVLLH